MLRRRDLLVAGSLAPLAAFQGRRKTIAVITTEYRRDSHADVIAGRLLEGYEYYGQRRQPRVKVVSMYTDQVPANDTSRALAAKYRFPILSTVSDALTLGTGKLAVDGVVLIGEHGNYADNEKGQKLYPRYELFRQVADVFRASGRAVPVFTDKHLSVDWEKARWMYDQSRELKFPLMAGSSLPVSWRKPPLELDGEAPVERAVCCFYGGKESYGFHALEALQCLIERRKGGETGVAAVHCLEGEAVWRWTDDNGWAGRLLDEALGHSETRREGPARGNVKQPILFLLEYRSGLPAAVYLLNGHVEDCTLAMDIRGREQPVSTLVWLQPRRPYSHFSSLVHYIEELIERGREPYPVERTLLTTGALAALMDSSFQGNARLETRHLNIAYRAPKESFFNQGPVPAEEKS